MVQPGPGSLGAICNQEYNPVAPKADRPLLPVLENVPVQHTQEITLFPGQVSGMAESDKRVCLSGGGQEMKKVFEVVFEAICNHYFWCLGLLIEGTFGDWEKWWHRLFIPWALTCFLSLSLVAKGVEVFEGENEPL